MRFCSKCGSQASEESKFCAKCGALLYREEASVQSDNSNMQAQQPNQAQQIGQAQQMGQEQQPDQAQQIGQMQQIGQVQMDQTQRLYTETNTGYVQYKPQEPTTQGYPNNQVPYYDGNHTNNYAMPQMPPSPPTKKKIGKLLAIGIPVVVVIAIAIGAVLFIQFKNSPLVVVGRAFVGLNAEVSERIDATPFQAFGILINALEEGTVTVNVDYRDVWLGDINGSIAFYSDGANSEYAVEAELRLDNRALELEVFMNKERIALGSDILGNDYYGITFSTFRDDIRIFGAAMGLDNQTIKELTEMVEMVEESLNAAYPESAVDAPYASLMTEFIRNLETTSEKTRIEVGSRTVRSTKIEFVVTDNDIITLLNNLVDLMAEDENLRNYFDSYAADVLTNEIFWGMQASTYNGFIREMRNTIRELDRSLSGEFVITFYVSSDNRLLRMQLDMDLSVDRNPVRVNCKFDFGESVTDPWELNFVVNSDGLRGESVTIVWDYRERSNRLINTLTISPSIDEQIVFSSEWSPDNGRFTLSYNYDRSMGELSGVFKVDENGFSLSIDDPTGTLGQSFGLEITAQIGAPQIKQIDFINIDRWDENLFSDFERALYSLLLP